MAVITIFVIMAFLAFILPSCMPLDRYSGLFSLRKTKISTWLDRIGHNLLNLSHHYLKICHRNSSINNCTVELKHLFLKTLSVLSIKEVVGEKMMQ
jgi:hypothetical protein